MLLLDWVGVPTPVLVVVWLGPLDLVGVCVLGPDPVDVRVFVADLAGVTVDLGDWLGDTGTQAPQAKEV